MPWLAVVTSGLLFGFAFPPHAVRLLSWIAFVPALVAVRRASARAAVGLAFLFALACTCSTVDWLPRTVARYYEQPWIVGLGLFLAIAVVMVVPPWTFFVLTYRALAARSVRGLAPLAAAAWVSGEFARANLWTGNPWVLFGYSQVDAVHLAQLADVTGVYGLSFVIVWINVAVAELLLTRDQPGRRGAALRSLALGLGLVGALWCYGYARLGALAAGAADSPGVKVAVVQGDIDLGTRWRPGMEAENLNAYLRLSDDLLRRGSPRLLVWPELAMTFFVEREPRYRAGLAAVASPHDVEVLTGGLHVLGPDDAPRYLNSAFALSSDGEVTGRYDKQQLLPFMEYFPFPQIDLLRRRFARARVLTPGVSVAPLATVAGPVGVVICNEALFSDFARARVRAGATWLAVLTNDSWLSDATFSGIAFDMARMRAIETHRTLVRAATWGPSAVVGPDGQVITRTGLGVAAVAEGTVRGRKELTPYVRIGDVFAGLCLAAVGLGLSWPSARQT